MPHRIKAQQLLKTEDIISCEPSSTLSQALAKLTSSHDAVFVVDKKQNLIGVISPYYVLIQGNYPSATKVENCLYSPPKIQESTSLPEIARNMIESKVYYLPVFTQGGKWVGIVTARGIITSLLKNQSVVSNLDIKRKFRLVTLSEIGTLGEARTLLRNKGVSRLPIIDKRGRLKGIFSSYDLREAFSKPKSSQRFLSRAGEKERITRDPIAKYMKKQVVTATDKTSTYEIVKTMNEKELGSIIIVNDKFQPVGIVTTKDILGAIASIGNHTQIKLTLNLPPGFSQENALMRILKKNTRSLRRSSIISAINLNLKLFKNSSGQTSSYEVSLICFRSKQKTITSQATDYSWRVALQEAIEKIEKQIAT